jgi:Peptidase family M1 domain
VLVPFLVAAACAAPAPVAQPRAERPRYRLDVRVAPSLRTVSGDIDVTFTPNRATDRIVFRLWANAARSRAEGSRLDVSGVMGGPVTRPDPTTLVVHRTLRAGQSAHVHIAWRLQVPRARDRISRYDRGVRLGSFFPILAWDPRRGWVTDPPAKILGESSTSAAADFDVRVHAPKGLTAVASGTRVGVGRWRAQAVRDVAVGVARFRISNTVAHVPNAVRVHVAIARGATGVRLARLAKRALEELSRRYGSYPWPDYTIVVSPDFTAGGIEYPTLSFVGTKSYVLAVVDHETAHQWFYSLVGNDQARDPWLDETLATWAQQRVDGLMRPSPPTLPRGAQRHVGEPMSYWTRYPRAYFYAVYDEGANALRSLGDDDLVDCALRAYAARQAYSIAQPGDLLDELERVIPGAERRLHAWGIHR